MATPTVFVICNSNCKYEGMTKEQILTAIMQAVNEGTIGDIDTGFITTVKTITGNPLRFFVGEQSEYDCLSDHQKENLFAIITNDTTKDELLDALERLTNSYNDCEKTVTSLFTGTGVVKKAETATKATKADNLDLGEPTNPTDNALPGEGYYLICADYRVQPLNLLILLNFGALYWDGETQTGAQGYGAYSMSIDSLGRVSINMKNGDVNEDITANCNIKIKQIGIA